MTDRPNLWQTAERVCTPKELEALELHHRRGLSYSQIALTLHIHPGSVRDRIKNAHRKIAAATRDAA
jgi:DNA-binding CsgD family transcriptional regulator